MRRPKPIDRESPFGINELFFSVTDPRGLILAGNSVFQRVSGYPTEALIGSPHNIIRHPDMPRAVFKLLWDTIKADRPISAYVKNLASDGSYYWVCATVYPIDGGYLSVRLKPSSALLPVVRDLYAAMLAAEKTGGVDAGTQTLVRALGDHGFDTYESFMSTALVTEIQSRQEKLAAAPGAGGSRVAAVATGSAEQQVLTKVAAAFGEMSAEYQRMFNFLTEFGKLNKFLKETIREILVASRDLHLISINMSLSATHIGSAAITIKAIASSFKDLATEVHRNLSQFSDSIGEIDRAMRAATFELASARLQVEMAAFFVGEILTGTAAASSDTTAHCQLLLSMSHRSTATVSQTTERLRKILTKFLAETADVENSVMGLEIIRQTGRIESMQIPTGSQSVDPYIDEMQRFVASIKGPVLQVATSTTDLVANIDNLLARIGAAGQTSATAQRYFGRYATLTGTTTERATG